MIYSCEKQTSINQGGLFEAALFLPKSVTFSNAWVGHLPFASWLIKQIKPKIFVELGTYSGNSYFTFCQSALEDNLQIKCYAVDTWQGDEHSGYYGEEIFKYVNTHNQGFYSGFSQLLRMSFDDANSYFNDKSIDLLHIDGLHTYEAVKNDFETWLPKLADGAFVLFHDTNVRERGFGVWKFWEELQSQFPLTLEFSHSHGLGVLKLDDGPTREQFPCFFADAADQQRLKNYFISLGARQIERFEFCELNQRIARRDEEVSYLNQVVVNRDEEITHLNKAVVKLNEEIYNLNQAVVKHNNGIVRLNQDVVERDEEIARLKQAVVNRDEEIARLNQSVVNRDEHIARLNQAVVNRDEEIVNLNRAVSQRDMKFARITSSKSWYLTKPLRFTGRVFRGEFLFALSPLFDKDPNRIRAFTRKIYHKLPLPQNLKFRLRERMFPLISALQQPPSASDVGRAVISVICGESNNLVTTRDYGREQALAKILFNLASHARQFGPTSHWLALPFLSTGGAEMVALNLCRALREIRPEHSVVLLITDRNLISEQIVLPDGVALIVFDEYLGGDLNYMRKQALLRDLLLAARPQCFHNINSEVAWHLIVSDGDRLKRIVPLYGSIFAFQFNPDGKTKIGYAAYFLKQSMPHLSGLITDNKRFVHDAAAEYDFDLNAKARMHTVYQPCRLLAPENANPAYPSIPDSNASVSSCRPKVLWAGRLDSEKRIDLFLNIVELCNFADFHVYGQVVLEGDTGLPALDNLSYEGPFSSPLQWIERHRYAAFLFTSKWEGMPNILIEAGALGIPVIAPTVGGVGELITERTGYPLPEQPSVEDYLTALKAVITDSCEAWERASRLNNLISERHSWSAFVTAVSALPGYALPSNAMADEIGSLEGNVTCSTMEASPIVSVIIPCYNQGNYLYDCVSSVLTACKADIEIIVVDDGSTESKIDHYLADLVKIAPDVVRIHRQCNQGLSGARNSGLDLAKGEFIQFLDSDDVLVPGKIDTQLAQLTANPLLDVSICNFLLSDETRSIYSKNEEAIAQFDLTLDDFLFRWERGFAIPIHCGLFRRHIFDELRFDLYSRAKEDWIFWSCLAISGVRFGYVHGHWAIYRQHDNSMRRSYLNMGRSWLQAGLKIDAMLGDREPLFFESVVTWFQKCYRENSEYKKEISKLQGSSPKNCQLAAVGDALVPSPGSEPSIDYVSGNYTINAEKLLDRLRVNTHLAQPPIISIIVPIYGHYNYLETCLNSIAEQGDMPFEIICIDDASPDPRVMQLMCDLRDQLPSLKITINSKNCGISAVQNAAVSIASGEYVAFLDCDDALEPDALSVIRDQILTRPDVDYFFTDRLEVNDKNNLVRTARYGGYDNLHFRSQEDIGGDLLDGMIASHLKVIRRSTYQKVGGCNPDFSGVQDWDLALKIAEQGKLHYINRSLYRHRVHRDSVTRSDQINQFRKTNIVRRHYCERWFRNSASTPEVSIGREISVSEFPVDLGVLKDLWGQGYRCIAKTTSMLSVSQINFLREFNSYFDRIEWNNPEIPASLFGYLWDPFIIAPGQSVCQVIE